MDTKGRHSLRGKQKKERTIRRHEETGERKARKQEETFYEGLAGGEGEESKLEKIDREFKNKSRAM